MANSNISRTIVTFLYLCLLFSPLVNCHNLLARPLTSGTCPKDTLKLRVCVDLLNWLINIRIGKPPSEPCCSLFQGLVDLDAAACLCTDLKANLLGTITIDIPLALTLILSACGKDVPSDFHCA